MTVKLTMSFALLVGVALSAAAIIPGTLIGFQHFLYSSNLEIDPSGAMDLEARGSKGSFEWRHDSHDDKHYLLARCERTNGNGDYRYEGKMVTTKEKDSDDQRVCWVKPTRHVEFPRTNNVRIPRADSHPELPDWDTDLFTCLPHFPQAGNQDDRLGHGGCWKESNPGEVPNHI